MSATRDYGLGRIQQTDRADLRYLMVNHPAFPTTEPVRAMRMYTIGDMLDQGETSECVGYSWRDYLNSAPNMWRNQGPNQDAIYAGAQALDGMALPHDGSTVRAGAQFLRSQGIISNFLWARSVQDIRRWILAGNGGVVLGTNWYQGMFTPAKGGVVRISGELAGGHAYFCFGYVRKYKAFRCQNSWGTDWAQGGRFWLYESDLARLLKEDGEAAAPLKLPYSPPLSTSLIIPASATMPTQLPIEHEDYHAA